MYNEDSDFSDRVSPVSRFAVADGVTLKKQQLSKREIGLHGPPPPSTITVNHLHTIRLPSKIFNLHFG